MKALTLGGHTLEAAAAKAGMSENTARKYRRSAGSRRLPSRFDDRPIWTRLHCPARFLTPESLPAQGAVGYRQQNAGLCPDLTRHNKEKCDFASQLLL